MTTDEIVKLEDQIEKLESDLYKLESDLYAAREEHKTLTRMVDRLAEIGLIDNNPHSKMLYVTGKREI